MLSIAELGRLLSQEPSPRPVLRTADTALFNRRNYQLFLCIPRDSIPEVTDDSIRSAFASLKCYLIAGIEASCLKCGGPVAGIVRAPSLTGQPGEAGPIVFEKIGLPLQNGATYDTYITTCTSLCTSSKKHLKSPLVFSLTFMGISVTSNWFRTFGRGQRPRRRKASHVANASASSSAMEQDGPAEPEATPGGAEASSDGSSGLEEKAITSMVVGGQQGQAYLMAALPGISLNTLRPTTPLRILVRGVKLHSPLTLDNFLAARQRGLQVINSTLANQQQFFCRQILVGPDTVVNVFMFNSVYDTVKGLDTLTRYIKNESFFENVFNADYSQLITVLFNITSF